MKYNKYAALLAGLAFSGLTVTAQTYIPVKKFYAYGWSVLASLKLIFMPVAVDLPPDMERICVLEFRRQQAVREILITYRSDPTQDDGSPD